MDGIQNYKMYEEDCWIHGISVDVKEQRILSHWIQWNYKRAKIIELVHKKFARQKAQKIVP